VVEVRGEEVKRKKRGLLGLVVTRTSSASHLSTLTPLTNFAMTEQRIVSPNFRLYYDLYVPQLANLRHSSLPRMVMEATRHR
jgi:hypothetical protein